MIRRGVPGDEEDLADVHITSWQVAYADIFPKGFLEDLDRVRRRDWWRDSWPGTNGLPWRRQTVLWGSARRISPERTIRGARSPRSTCTLTTGARVTADF